jgi:hypothetical protein
MIPGRRDSVANPREANDSVSSKFPRKITEKKFRDSSSRHRHFTNSRWPFSPPLA